MIYTYTYVHIYNIKTKFICYRWNSTFDSTYQLVTLLKDSLDKINQCLDYCNLQRLTNNDVKFLDEYCQVKCTYLI